MAHSVTWTASARDDLEDVAKDLHDSPGTTGALITEILRSTRRLRDFPLSGRAVPEFNDHRWREIQVHSFRILYVVAPGKVEVRAVLHSRRRLSPDEITRF